MKNIISTLNSGATSNNSDKPTLSQLHPYEKYCHAIETQKRNRDAMQSMISSQQRFSHNSSGRNILDTRISACDGLGVGDLYRFLDFNEGKMNVGDIVEVVTDQKVVNSDNRKSIYETFESFRRETIQAFTFLNTIFNNFRLNEFLFRMLRNNFDRTLIDVGLVPSSFSSSEDGAGGSGSGGNRLNFVPGVQSLLHQSVNISYFQLISDVNNYISASFCLEKTRPIQHTQAIEFADCLYAFANKRIMQLWWWRKTFA